MAFSTCSSPIRLSELLTCARLSTMCKPSVRSPVNDQSGPYRVTGEVNFPAAPLKESSNRDEVPHLIFGLRCSGYPCPRKRETHGGFHIQLRSSPPLLFFL